MWNWPTALHSRLSSLYIPEEIPLCADLNSHGGGTLHQHWHNLWYLNRAKALNQVLPIVGSCEGSVAVLDISTLSFFHQLLRSPGVYLLVFIFMIFSFSSFFLLLLLLLLFTLAVFVLLLYLFYTVVMSFLQEFTASSSALCGMPRQKSSPPTPFPDGQDGRPRY